MKCRCYSPKSGLVTTPTTKFHFNGSAVITWQWDLGWRSCGDSIESVKCLPKHGESPMSTTAWFGPTHFRIFMTFCLNFNQGKVLVLLSNKFGVTPASISFNETIKAFDSYHINIIVNTNWGFCKWLIYIFPSVKASIFHFLKGCKN